MEKKVQRVPIYPTTHICTASCIINIPHKCGPCVTTDAPTLTHHYHTESIADIQYDLFLELFIQWLVFFFSIITVTIFSLCVYQFASIVSDCSSPGSSVHGILQARILQWVVMPSSRGSSKPRERTHLPYSSSLGRRVVYHLYYLASPSQFMH